jgi:beta-lactamase class A
MTNPGNLERAPDNVEEIFRRAGCQGFLCVQALEGDGNLGLRAAEAVAPASVMKVQVALEAETWFADGRLDPTQRSTLAAGDRTPGPVGISLFSDDVTSRGKTWWSLP